MPVNFLEAEQGEVPTAANYNPSLNRLPIPRHRSKSSGIESVHSQVGRFRSQLDHECSQFCLRRVAPAR